MTTENNTSKLFWKVETFFDYNQKKTCPMVILFSSQNRSEVLKFANNYIIENGLELLQYIIISSF